MKKALAIGFILLAVFAGACNAEDGTIDTGSYVESEVTAEDVVDFSGPAVTAEFCRLYALIGDYDEALDAFTEGYGTTQNPSAQEVFDETLSRCGA